jgi:hypothetical protein
MRASTKGTLHLDMLVSTNYTRQRLWQGNLPKPVTGNMLHLIQVSKEHALSLTADIVLGSLDRT